MRIGILGGTFDPIHLGHLHLAKKVRDRLLLNKVIFIPTNLPPHKKNIRVTQARHRYDMIKLAIGNYKRFEVSDVELKRKGRSYSVETLKHFRKRHGLAAEIFFITGSDSLTALNKWKSLKRILRLCKFVIVKRPRFKIRGTPGEFIVLDVDAKDISSTKIRNRVRSGQGIGKFVPKKVKKYIQRHDLYISNPALIL